VKIDGKYRYRGGLTTKAMAERWIGEQIRREERADVLGLPVIDGEVTLKEFLPRWKRLIKGRLAESSFERYETIADRILSPWFGDRPLSQIQEGEIEEFLAGRSEKGNSPATINYYLAILSSILKQAVKDRYATRNPVRQVDRARVRLPPIPYLSREDEARLRAALPAWLRVPVLVALDAGLRAGEIRALRRRDIDLSRRVITVRESKNKHPREIGTTRRLHAALSTHLKSLPKGQEIVFLHPDGRLFERHIYRSPFKSAARRVDLETLRFHDLRHAAGVRLAEAGATPGEIAAFLGHRTLVMTMRYIRHAPRDAARTIARLLDRDEPEERIGS